MNQRLSSGSELGGVAVLVLVELPRGLEAELVVLADRRGRGAGPAPVVLVSGLHLEAAARGAEGGGVCGVAGAVLLHRLRAVREEVAGLASVSRGLERLVPVLLGSVN